MISNEVSQIYLQSILKGQNVQQSEIGRASCRERV